MRVYRVTLSGWTASFRHPQLVTGMQPTLPLPPPSTIYGLMSAAAGYWIDPADCQLAYVFKSEGEAQDLETIYQFGKSSDAKSNVVLRQWLTDWQLWLYFKERRWAEHFDAPIYPLVLGRQQELAHVEAKPGGSAVTEVELVQDTATLHGTAVPFPFWEAAGMVMALPLAMSPDLPRQAVGVRPWQLVREPITLRHADVWRDAELQHGIYFIGGEHGAAG
jgi:CRISPR-associated protein Cas5t